MVQAGQELHQALCEGHLQQQAGRVALLLETASLGAAEVDHLGVQEVLEGFVLLPLVVQAAGAGGDLAAQILPMRPVQGGAVYLMQGQVQVRCFHLVAVEVFLLVTVQQLQVLADKVALG